MINYACLEICDKEGCQQASAEGPREEALKEAIHYFHQYGLDWPMPVSYTHLDVDKRQELNH